MGVKGLRAGWLASLPEPTRRELAAALSPADARALLYDWPFWARPAQLPPQGNWRIWLLLAGRGFGKTRTGAELIRARVAASTARRLALVAPTAADARNVMVEGESGILAISPPWDRPRYEPSKRRLTWPNGAIATLYSADEPERLRGPQHDATWCDELASWRYPEAWDMLMFGMRLGPDPRAVVTTTPRPTKLIRTLIADPTAVVTRGSTYENRANLAPAFLDQIIRKYEGTRLGRQEIEAELLDDVPGALWTRGIIDH
jgi:phage terminase large subunit-like protein